jgi:hypothetical protein
MNNYALIDTTSSRVSNVFVWDGEAEWSPPDGYFAEVIPENEKVQIGDLFQDGSFIPKTIWFSTTDNNIWEGKIYNTGDMMISYNGTQPPNSTQTPPPRP